ncbi:HAD domain-containing protein [Cupriavidus campinensis]|uniref:HAD domain-containing protein n=1 Tax=Cupriavidus campinensis TaxID=151783 RepID=UPI0024E20952|nr:HAD domain-containing protein [Cupriavidus campinensis]
MTAETPFAPLRVLYLDFDGPMHPDSVYRTRNGIELLHYPGHSLFEHVPLLEDVLDPYPDVRIVLSTSWQLLEGGCEYAASCLSECLQARCIGGTFDRRRRRKAWFERMSRPDQVLLDVKWRKPAGWVAVDDSPEEWPFWTRPHVVRTDAVLGIAEPTVLEKLKATVRHQFGGPPP